MDLNQTSARIRPRHGAEAIDLGFLMVRQWWKPLFLLQLLVCGPTWAVLYLITQSLPLTLLLMWWLKPVFETFLLQYIGRALFDEALGIRPLLRHWLAIFFHEIIAKLTWRRFQWLRSMHMPISELEQLKGRARLQRLKVLGRGSTGAGLWLGALCGLLEVILCLDLLMFLFFMLPTEFTDRIDWNTMLSDQILTGLLSFSAIVAMILVMPFYVASGFCLYINRRTWLEGWDIELAFKRLARRLDDARKPNTRSPLILLVAFLAVHSPEGVAAPETVYPPSGTHATPMTPEGLRRTREAVIDILEGPEYQRYETHQVLLPIDDQTETRRMPGWLRRLLSGLEWLGNGVAQATEVLMWTAVILAMLLLARVWPRLRLQWRRSALRFSRRHAAVYAIRADGASDTLPDDIPGTAAQFWQEGSARDALSLLYRGALVSLSARFQLPLHISHTEIESVELCQARCPAVVGHYFNRLTQAWMRLAYAHRTISDEEFQDLLRGWAFFQQDQSDVTA